MKIIDVMKYKEGVQYAIELEPGFMVEVKRSVECNTTYVMQNHDGSTVFWEDNPDVTFPDYEYDEEAVLKMVKAYDEETFDAKIGAL